MPKLSVRQERMLKFIEKFLDEERYPPTVRDIQRGCDISSTSVVDYNIRILQEKGHLRRTPDVSRGLRLADAPRTMDERMTIPIIGYIAAGTPVPVPTEESWGQAEPMDVLDVPEHMVRSDRELYALRVRGQSMIDALIDHGDLVVLSPSVEVHDGDMVVAWLKLEKEATLKRIYREGRRIRLQPANTQMQPIYTSADNVEVQGKVVAVLRVI